jgi:hypothetical protein
MSDERNDDDDDENDQDEQGSDMDPKKDAEQSMTNVDERENGQALRPGEQHAAERENGEATGEDAPSERAEANVAQATLETTPRRAMIFIYGVARSPEIRRKLATRGFGPDTQQQGLKLLHRACAYEEPVEEPRTDAEVREAGDKINEEGEDLFRVVRASLGHRHPQQAAFLLQGIVQAKGAQAVLNVSLFLERIEELRNGPARQATRAADHAALAILARRGIGPVELAGLAKLVRIAYSAKSVADDGQRERLTAERQAALVALRTWYEEWSELARACIKRRDLLQNLGLARRVRRGASEANGAESGSGGPADGTPDNTPDDA